MSFKAWKVSRRQQTHAQPDFFTKSTILDTSEHRSTIKVLLVGTLQQELQVTSRQILGGLSQSLATLRLNLLFVSDSPACIKRLQHLALAASSLSDVGGDLPSLGAVRPGRLMRHAQCHSCWYHVQVHIETTCFCCISELTHSTTLSRTVLSRGKGMLVSETLPTCSVQRLRFPAHKTQ